MFAVSGMTFAVRQQERFEGMALYDVMPSSRLHAERYRCTGLGQIRVSAMGRCSVAGFGWSGISLAQADGYAGMAGSADMSWGWRPCLV